MLRLTSPNHPQQQEKSKRLKRESIAEERNGQETQKGGGNGVLNREGANASLAFREEGGPQSAPQVYRFYTSLLLCFLFSFFFARTIQAQSPQLNCAAHDAHAVEGMTS